MKKFFIFCIAVFIFFLLFQPSFVWAAAAGYGFEKTEEVVDSERAAQYWAGAGINRYEGGYYFGRYENNQFSEWMSVEFRLSVTTGEVTYLTVNDQLILDVEQGDSPLPALPSNEKGEARDFSFWLGAYSDFSLQDFKGSAYLYKERLLPGETIVVQLKPARVLKFIPFELPDGVDADDVEIRTIVEDSYNYYSSPYDERAGGFQLFVDPTIVAVYKIINLKSGVSYRIGQVDFWASAPESQSHVVDIGLSGNVKEIVIDNNYAWLGYQMFGGQVERCEIDSPKGGCKMVQAKVYFVDVEGQPFTVYAGSMSGELQIEVREWVRMGQPPLIGSSVQSLSLRSGYRKVLITIVPPDDYNFDNYFGISINIDSYYRGNESGSEKG